jgi:hypothetical protein
MAGNVQSIDSAELRRWLEAKLGAAGIDPARPDFLRRAYDQLVASRARLAAFNQLVQRATLAQTPAAGSVSAPNQGQRPQLGTTVGDTPQLGLGADGDLDDGKKFKDDFLDQMWSHFEQGGLKISPSDAASSTDNNFKSGGGVGSEPAQKSPEQKSLDDAKQALDQAMQDFWRKQEDIQYLTWLSIAAAATDEATQNVALIKATEIQVKQQLDRIKDAENKAKQLLNQLQQPNPDAPDPGGTLSVGGNAPKKPGKPGDPLPEDPGNAPSRVPKQRGQSSDPNPAADYWGLGDPKTIRGTSDAVTDPPRAAETFMSKVWRAIKG